MQNKKLLQLLLGITVSTSTNQMYCFSLKKKQIFLKPVAIRLPVGFLMLNFSSNLIMNAGKNIIDKSSYHSEKANANNIFSVIVGLVIASISVCNMFDIDKLSE